MFLGVTYNWISLLLYHEELLLDANHGMQTKYIKFPESLLQNKKSKERIDTLIWNITLWLNVLTGQQ